MRLALAVCFLACACSRSALDAPDDLGGVDALRPIAPLSTSTVTTQSPTFRWTGGHGALVEVCAERACTTIEATALGTGTSAKIASALSAGVHFFRLRPLIDGAPVDTTTAVWEFRVPHRSSPRDTSWGVFPDFDGDGIADLLVRSDVSQVVDVYAGSKTSVGDDHRVEIKVDDGVVDDVAAIGDVDGDGFGDLAVTRCGGSTCGVVSIYRGGANGIATKPSFTIDPPSDVATTHFGAFVSSAGDLNGDGYADLLVASSRGMVTDQNEGRIYVYFGGAGGPATSPSATLRPDAQFDLFMAEAGDVDGDGFADLVVIGQNIQKTGHHDAVLHFYPGAPSGPSDATRTELGTFPSDACAYSSPTPADFDGDGFADIAIGFLRCDAPVGPGSMTIFYGGAGGSRQTTVTAPVPFVGFGFDVRSGGDIDGDGFDDLVTTMSMGDPSTGAAIFWGSSSGVTDANETTFAVSNDDDVRSSVGLAVADYDGDGLDDIAVGRLDATPITVYSLVHSSMTAKSSFTPPGAQQFYFPIMR